MNWRVATIFSLVGLVWGSAWIPASALPDRPIFVGAIRFGIAAAVLGLLELALTKKRKVSIHKTPLIPSIVLGVAMLGLPYALATWAKGTVSSGLIAVGFATMPLFTLFFSGEFGGAPGAIPAIAIGIGGVAFLVAQGVDYSSSQVGGLFLLVAVVVLGAFSLHYAKRRLPKGTFIRSSAIQSAVACVLLLFLSGIGGWQRLVNWSWNSVPALMALTITEGVIALPLLFWLLSEMEAWQVATLQWLATFVAVAEAGVLLQAKPTWQMGLGSVIVMGTIAWILLPRNRTDPTAGIDSDTVTLQITGEMQSDQEAGDAARE
jgi:drug/metabolite transporter (DMT)-like permease